VALEPTAPVQVWLWWLATAALIAGAGYVAYKKRDGGNGSAGDAAAGGGVGSGSTSRRGEPGVSGGGGVASVEARRRCRRGTSCHSRALIGAVLGTETPHRKALTAAQRQCPRQRSR
jgi:hypothetical protein